MQVAYESPPSRRVYELRKLSGDASLGVWLLARVSELVELVRDGAVERLRGALTDQATAIERALVGRKADGADHGPASLRVRIVPLPSIGHEHADRGVRRVDVEVPAGCPVRAADVHWAFSGLELIDRETGEVLDLILIPSADENMLGHYGVADHARLWRTVTPAALPESAKRRRIDPTRVMAEAKDGAERAAEQARAASAVVQALRHAEVRARAEEIRVQREPFEGRGERVEAFASATRFSKERFWHVEIAFSVPVPGPLVIGDGRFLGLGVMRPVKLVEGIRAFTIESGLAAAPQPTEVARALRRAVMARVQTVLGRASLPAFFSGHELDGSQARTERHPHLAFLFDPQSARLMIVAPHVVDRRAPTPKERQDLATLRDALADFRDLRAGHSGRLLLRAISADAGSDPLLAASQIWESVNSYQVTRHAKKVGAGAALTADILDECRRRGLPKPRVTPLDMRGVSGVGLLGGARLTFEVAVAGPIVLGKDRHLGGGLFAGRSR